MRRIRTPFPYVSYVSFERLGGLTPYVAAEKAFEAFIALASAFGSKDFFKNKGPDPTVRDVTLRLPAFC